MGDDLPWNLNILDPMDDDFKFRFIDVSGDDVDELMYGLNIVLKFLCEYGKKRDY